MSLITKIKFIDGTKGKSLLKNLDVQLHDHLTDNADWDAEHWDFEPEFLQEYAKKLETLISESESGIIFEALWASDDPHIFVELSPTDFLEIIRSNKIGTQTQYFVNKNV